MKKIALFSVSLLVFSSYARVNDQIYRMLEKAAVGTITKSKDLQTQFDSCVAEFNAATISKTQTLKQLFILLGMAYNSNDTQLAEKIKVALAQVGERNAKKSIDFLQQLSTCVEALSTGKATKTKTMAQLYELLGAAKNSGDAKAVDAITAQLAELGEK